MNMPRPNELGALLRLLRERKGLSGAEASKRAGIKSKGRWSELEAGKQSLGNGKTRPAKPNARQLQGILRALRPSTADAKRLFELSGYGDLFEAIYELGNDDRPDAPSTAEAGISRDRSLTEDERGMLLELVARVKRGRPAREAGEEVG